MFYFGVYASKNTFPNEKSDTHLSRFPHVTGLSGTLC